jgi:hypothetical protein
MICASLSAQILSMGKGNIMEGVTIPKPVYETALMQLQEAYNGEFDESGAQCYATRQDFVDAYKARHDFWDRHLPEIDIQKGPPTIETIAVHAICSNAKTNIVQHVNARLGTTKEDPFAATMGGAFSS